MTSSTLFSPLQVGRFRLAHRVVMAPLTRMRAARQGNAPTALMAEYYGQRASEGGLIIAEAAPVAVTGHGNPCSPGVYTPEQVAGWKAVTKAVHGKGGVFFLQLWHVGRISHPSHQPGEVAPIAPSAIAAKGQAFTADFRRVPFGTPRALERIEIHALVEAYARAALHALEAGFDGVEVHAANGYLIEQFLQSRANTRTDEYGGSIENRARFLLEVVAAVVAAIGPDRVGVRLSPYGRANDSGEDDPAPLYAHAIGELSRFDLAYLHIIEPRASGAGQSDVNHKDVPPGAETVRPLWNGVLITAGNFTPESAASTVAAGYADAIAFGRWFISNPDLPERLRRGAALNPYHRETFYGGGAEGYTDYPFLAQAGSIGE